MQLRMEDSCISVSTVMLHLGSKSQFNTRADGSVGSILRDKADVTSEMKQSTEL